MVNFKIEQVREIMNNPENIRNMCVIAHVDHGKTTLTDSLVAKAGLISGSTAGEHWYTHSREDEQIRGITIKSTGITMYYEYDLNQQGVPSPYLLNLIDSPGHVDFSSEVTAALRVTDGALVVVDAVEGVSVQTETVLRQAMQEKIKPVLMINKIDRSIFELKLDGEAIYQNFIRIVDLVNVIISTYEQNDMGSLLLDPANGSVGFGSGKECWGFTLRTFAQFYSKKFNIPLEKLQAKFWGNNFFNPNTKKWSKEEKDAEGVVLKRGFVEFIMDPILKLTHAIMEGKIEVFEKLIKTCQIELSQAERTQKGKQLLRTVMSKWINAADTILEMMIVHLPSPKVAQKYRTGFLYQGPQDDAIAQAMRECDPKGPLMMYVSKMVPTSDNSRFLAFGRVFSGTISAGQKVRILGPNFQHGKKEDLHEKPIQRTILMMGRNMESLTDVPCGNTVALAGVDEFLRKTGTITDNVDAWTIRNMKYSVSPVVRVAVNCKNPADLPKLVEGLKRLAKSDPLVVCSTEETGEHIIAGCGELHVEICLKDLEDFAKCEIIHSDPIVTYKETVNSQSNMICMAKSPNRHNRLHGQAINISENLAKEIEDGKVGPEQDPKTRAKYLEEEYQWESHAGGQKLWSFGPENSGPNVLIDSTKGLQFMNEIRDSVDSAFQHVTKHGVLTEESLRGVRFDLSDAVLHPDSIHRGAGQIIPVARRLFYACELTAGPKLQEPVFLCEITAPATAMGGVYQCLSQRRGIIHEEEPVHGTPLSLLKCYLPVVESFGFTSALRGFTQGQAFPQCVFDHWQLVQGNPLEKANKASDIVIQIRKRKGLSDNVPPLENYLDKL